MTQATSNSKNSSAGPRFTTAPSIRVRESHRSASVPDISARWSRRSSPGPPDGQPSTDADALLQELLDHSVQPTQPVDVASVARPLPVLGGRGPLVGRTGPGAASG